MNFKLYWEPIRLRMSLEELLNLKLLIEDGPDYRRRVLYHENQIDSLAGYLESAMKEFRNILELSMKVTEHLSGLKVSLEGVEKMYSSPTNSTTAAPSAGLAVLIKQTIMFLPILVTLQERMIKDLSADLLISINHSILDDISELKQLKREVDRQRDRYENYLSRYASLPKLKEYSAVREDAFHLFQVRREYLVSQLNYVNRMDRLLKGANLFLVEKGLASWSLVEQYQFIMNDLMKSIQAPLHSQLKDQLSEWQEDVRVRISSADSAIKEATNQLIPARYSPDSPYYQSGKGHLKEGYLFKGRRKRSNMATKSISNWRRVYAVMREDGYITLTGSDNEKSKFNVLLCEVKQALDEDRRHCFELHSVEKSIIVLQAEGEEEMRDWMRVIENAKVYALHLPEQAEKADEGAVGGDTVEKREDKVVGEWTVLFDEQFGTLTCTSLNLTFQPLAAAEVQEVSFSWKELKMSPTSQSSFNLLTVIQLEHQKDKSTSRLITIKTFGGDSLKEQLYSLINNNHKTATTATEVDCACKGSHDELEKRELDTIIPVNIDTLFHLLMDTDSPVLRGVWEEQHYKNAILSEWTTTDGSEERTLQITVPVNHPLVKVNETICTEKHVILLKIPGKAYVIRQEAQTPDITYGDTFIMQTQVCLTAINDQQTRLRVQVGVRWTKSPPLFKSMIKSGTMKGMAAYQKVYRQVLFREVHALNPGDQAEEMTENVIESVDEKENVNASISILNYILSLFKSIRESVTGFNALAISKSLCALLTIVILFMVFTFYWISPQNTIEYHPDYHKHNSTHVVDQQLARRIREAYDLLNVVEWRENYIGYLEWLRDYIQLYCNMSENRRLLRRSNAKCKLLLSYWKKAITNK